MPLDTTSEESVPRPWYENEKKWVELQPFLLSVGYQLRPRYHPDWSPSWMVPGAEVTHPEDHLPCFKQDVLDAVRIHDGRKVVLKRVPTDSDEIKIIQYLLGIEDPRNHTIPLLDIVPVPPDNEFSLMVMPYTRRFNHPSFHCRAEFVEAMQKLLEGLQFMHDNHVVHYDIAPQNLMMEESRVVPAGSHFFTQRSHTGFPGIFSWNHRCTVGPVKYYYIDFGLSMYFPEGKDSALTTGTLRTFKTIPELSLTVPYNPFKVDVFQLGLTMHKLIDTYPALKTFRPVADRMTSSNPSDRPEPQESLKEFDKIVENMGPEKLKAPTWEKKGTISYLAQSAMNLIRKDYPPSQRYESMGY
ncbi:kinase domain-containing protein [Favolaschia claudopus]|uniref:Kinase domain-containing protein n=1 Tax=Favolaschia claudopus TaxID=2862362 RepID=A0AAW0BZF0_9AGAR